MHLFVGVDECKSAYMYMSLYASSPQFHSVFDYHVTTENMNETMKEKERYIQQYAHSYTRMPICRHTQPQQYIHTYIHTYIPTNPYIYICKSFTKIYDFFV